MSTGLAQRCWWKALVERHEDWSPASCVCKPTNLRSISHECTLYTVHIVNCTICGFFCKPTNLCGTDLHCTILSLCWAPFLRFAHIWESQPVQTNQSPRQCYTLHSVTFTLYVHCWSLCFEHMWVLNQHPSTVYILQCFGFAYMCELSVCSDQPIPALLDENFTMRPLKWKLGGERNMKQRTPVNSITS